MKNKKILFIIIVCALIFFLVGCSEKNENEELKEKTNASIKHIDNSLISLLNKLNNISFENYYVTTQKIKLDSSSENGNNTEEISKSSEISKKQDSGEDSSSSTDDNSKDSKSKITLNDMKSKNILLSDRNKIDWDQIKTEAEGLYSIWNTVIIDLYKLGINNDDILQFSDLLDSMIANVKQSNREASLMSIASLYSSLPLYISTYSNDRIKTNLIQIKSHVINAYSAVGNGLWNTVSAELNSADQVYNSIMTDAEFVNDKPYNANKAYIALKEMQSSIDLQDAEIFYIKYINFMEEINTL